VNLLASELVRRAKVKGYTTLGISDHADSTNLEMVVGATLNLVEKARFYEGITIIPGVELTHVPKKLIGELIRHARNLGAFYVVVHGETIVEPVEEGTNRAASRVGPTSLLTLPYHGRGRGPGEGERCAPGDYDKERPFTFKRQGCEAGGEGRRRTGNQHLTLMAPLIWSVMNMHGEWLSAQGLQALDFDRMQRNAADSRGENQERKGQ